MRRQISKLACPAPRSTLRGSQCHGTGELGVRGGLAEVHAPREPRAVGSAELGAVGRPDRVLNKESSAATSCASWAERPEEDSRGSAPGRSGRRGGVWRQQWHALQGTWGPVDGGWGFGMILRGVALTGGFQPRAVSSWQVQKQSSEAAAAPHKQ